MASFIATTRMICPFSFVRELVEIVQLSSCGNDKLNKKENPRSILVVVAN